MHTSKVLAFFVAVAVAAGIVLGLSSPVLAAKTAQAERYDADLALSPDGALDVTETVVFRYSGGPFTYVKREIPANRTDGLQFLSAAMDGRPLPQGASAGQVEVQGGSKMTVTFHFEPVSDAVHTFTLSYRALGVAEKLAAADRLVFTPLPREHDYSIAASTVRVTYPQGAVLQGQPRFSEGMGTIERGAGRVIFQSGGLAANQSLEVTLEFAPGSLAAGMPAWQAREQERAGRETQTLPIYAAVALLLAGGGAAGLWIFQRRTRLEPVAGLDGLVPSPLAPADHPPAVVGALLARSGESSPAGLLATLFDLARRGVLVIEEVPGRGWLAGRDFTVRLLKAENLRPFENALLKELFRAGRSVSLAKEGQRLVQKWGEVAALVKEEMLEAGLLDPERLAARRRWTRLAVWLLILSLAAWVGLAILTGSLGTGILLPGGVLAILAAALLILAAQIVPLSDRGRWEAARWKTYRAYLEEVRRGREPSIRPDLFEASLPFAAAFGFAAGWARFFHKRGLGEVPAWFQALGQDGSDMAAFVAMVDSSSSSAGGDGGAGAGASAGGGSSSTG